ncbi:MAG: hypothetical protein EHM49_00275 [Deltaproteobacteria bacterium]|nr:MAG: hypothetical protein EHM49_05330 [Deltaproteobacteria bacterium]RPI52604.1 MAG: hypothetical protein EHM49_05295 [Deltaproteobacteria bacterium]RPI56463.1 MAG: hypothetical protein EHM49_00275 [Deltaproteobacteria bacterium]
MIEFPTTCQNCGKTFPGKEGFCTRAGKYFCSQECLKAGDPDALQKEEHYKYTQVMADKIRKARRYRIGETR